MKERGKYYCEGEVVVNGGEGEGEGGKWWRESMDKMGYVVE